FDSYSHCANRRAVADANANAAAALSGIQTVHGNKRLRYKFHSGQVCGVQGGSDFAAVHPRCDKFFKRRFRATTDGYSSTLQNLESGINDGALDRTQIGRWRNPTQTGAFEKIRAAPGFHGDDM